MKKESASSFAKKDVTGIIMIAAGTILSLLTYLLVQRLEFTDVKTKFTLDAQNYSVALEKSIGGNLSSLDAVEGLYATSYRVTRARFHTFANKILPHSEGLHALRWLPRVEGRERKRYEAVAVRDGYPTYHFTEFDEQKKLVTAGKRDEYFPVYFSEPCGKNEAALGLDLSANPHGKLSLEKARDTGAAVATRRITLFLEGDNQYAFLVYQPVYRNGSLHDTVPERRKNLIGFAMGVFRLGDMVDTALKGINLKGIEIALYDEASAPERRLLYSNVRPNNPAGEILNFSKIVDVADRKWTVKFYATPEYLSKHKSLYSWTVLAGGLLLTSLLALYISKMRRHGFEIERSKNIMAAVLNSINAAIAIVDSKDLRILAYNKVFIREPETGDNEITGRRCIDTAHKRLLPCDQSCEECPITLTMRTGKYSARESVHHCEDGSAKYIEISAYPVKDDAGDIRHVVHVAQDITERKQKENSLLEEQQMRRMSAERQVVETQLRMLQAQIEPHFLFNTLANVISIVDKKPKSAKNMLEHLTSSLRLSLQRSREDESTLEQEAKMLKDYLSIFKMRMGPRLDFTIEIPVELLKLQFPPMLLQPLVENAIKHGIEPKIEGGLVAIKAERSNGLLRLSVSDTGLGFSSPVNDQGVGLENVKARLQALYKSGASLVLEENVPCGVTATIEVPL